MTRNASSLPARKRRTSCSSLRSRSSGAAIRPIVAAGGTPLEARPAAAGMVDASTRSLLPGQRSLEHGVAVLNRLCARLGQIGHHVLDLRVVLEAVLREVLAVAGLLEAAVR